MDKRRSPRVALMAELTYQVDGIAITKRISDLSEGGVFVDTPVPSELGTRLRLRFVVDGETVEADGKVVYSQPFIGMGVEFTSLSAEHRDIVRRFVSRLSSQPVGVQ